MEKMAVEGGYVMMGTDLFDIVDLSEVWIEASVYEYQLPWIEVGQFVMATLPELPGKMLHGTINYIYPYLDMMNRTARVRMVFPNPNLELKMDSYAEIQIETRVRENALAVPREAVIRSGKRDVVFLALGEGKFKPQQVTLGLEADSSQYEVLSGLAEGNLVVTSSQFLLDSESQLQEAIQKLRGPSTEDSAIQGGSEQKTLTSPKAKPPAEQGMKNMGH